MTEPKKSISDFDYNDKLAFRAEWYDYEMSFHKKFILNYFPYDNTLELYDSELHRVYLKRAKCEGIQLKDVFVGNTIRVYGRQVEIKDYADCRTKEFVGRSKDHTFAIIKPSAMHRLGEIIQFIQDSDFLITRLRMSNLTRKEALDFYESKKGDAFLPFMVEHIVSGPTVALELVGEDAINRWKSLVGPVDPAEARKTNPDCLTAKYGIDRAANGFHAAADHDNAVKEACFFFPQGIDKKPPSSTVLIKNSTCCVIKPHAINEGKLGPIIAMISDSNNFKITAMQMCYLTNMNADELLEVYKGVVTDYHSFLTSFLDGPCVALEISGKHEKLNVHQEFRRFAGPSDSDIARQIRPNTLRARFGVDKYRNAVHCTDLPEDTVLELEYFFKILDS